MLVFDIRTIGDVSSYRQTEIMRSFASPALAPPAWRHRHSSDDFGISKLKPLAYSRRVLLIASDATQRFRNDEFKITCPRRLQHGLNAASKNQRGASKIASLASSMIDLMRLQPHNRRLPDQSDMVKGVFATAVAALVYISPMIFA